MGENNWDILRIVGLVVAALVVLWFAKALILPLLGLLLGLLWAVAGLAAGVLHLALFVALVGGLVYGVLLAFGLVSK